MATSYANRYNQVEKEKINNLKIGDYLKRDSGVYRVADIEVISGSIRGFTLEALDNKREINTNTVEMTMFQNDWQVATALDIIKWKNSKKAT